MTEPPNTEALLATVREALDLLAKRWGPLNEKRYVTPARAALDAIASELEAERFARKGTLAELKRVRAERDAARMLLVAPTKLQRRLDRAVEVLREIAEMPLTYDEDDPVVVLARAALAEIEESE